MSSFYDETHELMDESYKKIHVKVPRQIYNEYEPMWAQAIRSSAKKGSYYAFATCGKRRPYIDPFALVNYIKSQPKYERYKVYAEISATDCTVRFDWKKKVETIRSNLHDQ